MSKKRARLRDIIINESLLNSPLPLYDFTSTELKSNIKTGCKNRLETLPVIKHIFTSPIEPESILIEDNNIDNIGIDKFYDKNEFKLYNEIEKIKVYQYNVPITIHDQDDDTLIFDSVFESGNLLQAKRIKYNNNSNNAIINNKKYEGSHLNGKIDTNTDHYELLIHPDVNNKEYRQWFYFQVKNGKSNRNYTFTITNLAKAGSLFGMGLQPCVYSEYDAIHNQIGWVHRGFNIKYFPTIDEQGVETFENTLKFTYKMNYDNDTVYFACLAPYTYSDLLEYLNELEKKLKHSGILRRTELCQTVAQNSCELITITASSKDNNNVIVPYDQRRVIIISSRVHPGESNSSWMMKGMIDYLVDLIDPGAAVLRETFIFKIVPMLNPDGVINGNTRVNLSGWDLNRKWDHPVEKLFPTIYHLKNLINNLSHNIAIYCDLHGHSINPNIFTYGCFSKKKMKKKKNKNKNNIKSNSNTNQSNVTTRTDPRLFPMIVAKKSPFFAFSSCNFSVQKSKQTTARVVIYNEFNISNSYTLEASFCGPNFGSRKNTQFSIKDLEQMGEHWCKSLIVYFDYRKYVQLKKIQKNGLNGIDTLDATSHLNINQFIYNGIHSENNKDLSISIPQEDDILNECESAVSQLLSEDISDDDKTDKNENEDTEDDEDENDLEFLPDGYTKKSENNSKVETTERITDYFLRFSTNIQNSFNSSSKSITDLQQSITKTSKNLTDHLIRKSSFKRKDNDNENDKDKDKDATIDTKNVNIEDEILNNEEDPDIETSQDDEINDSSQEISSNESSNKTSDEQDEQDENENEIHTFQLENIETFDTNINNKEKLENNLNSVNNHSIKEIKDIKKNKKQIKKKKSGKLVENELTVKKKDKKKKIKIKNKKKSLKQIIHKKKSKGSIKLKKNSLSPAKVSNDINIQSNTNSNLNLNSIINIKTPSDVLLNASKKLMKLISSGQNKINRKNKNSNAIQPLELIQSFSDVQIVERTLSPTSLVRSIGFPTSDKVILPGSMSP